MTEPENKKPDPLLERLKNAGKSDLAGSARRAIKGADELGRNINDVAQGISKAAKTMGWIKNNVLSPVWSVLDPFLGWGARAYGRLWNRVVNQKDADGDVVFSKKRAGVMVIASVFAAAAVVELVPEVTRSVGFAAWWAATNKTEILILNKSDLKKEEESYIASGCHSWPCTSDNTIDFIIDESLFHDAHRLITHHEMFYASYISDAIPAVPSACEIDYYGWRGKIAARWGHTHPRLFDVKSCVPIPAGFPEGPVTREAFNKLRGIPVEKSVAPQAASVPTQAAPAP